MKTHQFRYALIFLPLTLFAVTLVVYSQEDTAQSNGEPHSITQSSEESTPLETQDTKPETEEQKPEPSPDVSQEPLKNPSQIYTMIFGASIVLVLAVAIFLDIRRGRQLRGRVEASEQRLQQRLDNSEERWDGRLNHINQQGKDNAQKLEEMVSNHAVIHNEQENLQNLLSKLGDRLEGLELKLSIVPDKTADVEAIVQEAQARVELLAKVYENGEPIDIVEIDDPTPSHKALMILNWIGCTIEDWENELEQSETANPAFIQTLGFANQSIKDILKEVRGPAPPLPEPLNPDADVSTEAVYNEFKDKCTAYVARYEGVLIGYQMGCQTAETDYNQFIPQFIKDRLFNGVARFIKSDQLPKQVDELLAFVGYEVVPIEIGRTQADARIHEIQSSQQTNAESGTIVEVVLPGLQRKADGEIIQKPVVIRGE